jgi:hypothetical protein
MNVRRRVLLAAAGVMISAFGMNSPAVGGEYGCGSPPVPSCYAQPAPAYPYGYSRCPPYCYGCCHKCCHRGGRDRGASRGAEENNRSSAPVVSSMPVFSSPMMFTSVPVMPTLSTRSAQPDTRSALDCCERVNRLEENVQDLARAVRDLQLLVLDQGRVLEKITVQLDPPGSE